MVRKLFPLALGLLVFFISFQWLNEEPVEDPRVLSTSETTRTQGVEVKKESIVTDQLEKAPVKQNYKPAVHASSEQYGITPDRIEIPTIDVDASIQALGYTPDGGMAVPKSLTDVGWFEPGTMPGNQGNSVIAGHVDGNSGPAVFYDLKDLSPGDEIHVYDENTKLTFEVSRIESYPYKNAPIREIFGPTNTRNLNLITCTGPYDDEASTYSERLAVFTVLTDRQEL
ncbi:class F sortase [Halobacillus sp. SY10]|uniref:LPXTG-site transpeptidase (Sortase) family protein n=2 Tax=Halobacillus TaxID=45667 RepID=A0A1H0S5C3_HALAD|nr:MULTISPECIES: class F sortase [Halobacillus]RDY69994.1 class F sortase [Halobacillus trueperi]SDP36973.1 LPXTG-site transpeptidase (sortase) family protein [Halobacillus aidingensis]